MVEVTCARKQKVYSTAMDVLYCGYRAVYEIRDMIDSLVKVRYVNKILTTEYHLGYIFLTVK